MAHPRISRQNKMVRSFLKIFVVVATVDASSLSLDLDNTIFACANDISGQRVFQMELREPSPNNLGGLGPNPPAPNGAEQIMRYNNIFRHRGRSVNLEVKAEDGYQARTPSRNGVFGTVGNINQRSAQVFYYDFSLRYDDGTVATIPWIQWSIYNFDQNNAGQRKCVSLSDFAAYTVTPSTSVIVSKGNSPSEYQFCSDYVQMNINVMNPTQLTQEQADVSVAFVMEYASSWRMTVDLTQLSANGGRNLQFSGNNDWVCNWVPGKWGFYMTSPQGITSPGFRSELLASCVFDAIQSLTYLSQAGTAIDAAIPYCDRNTVPGPINCWIQVTDILESFSYSVSFISAAANQCDVYHQNVDAQCTSDIAGLIGALADVMQAAGGLSAECPESTETGMWPDDLEPIPNGPTQKPPGDPVAHPIPVSQQTVPQRKWGAKRAFCAIDAMQATWYLASAGLNIDAANKACRSHMSQEDPYCATSVSAVIMAFSYVAGYIAAAAWQCVDSINKDAMCASDVSRLVAAVSSLAARAASMSQYCTLVAKAESEDAGYPTKGRKKVRSGRRLLGNKSTFGHKKHLPVPICTHRECPLVQDWLKKMRQGTFVNGTYFPLVPGAGVSTFV